MTTLLNGIGGSARQALFMFLETFWALVLGFALSGAVQAFVTRGQMERVLGRRSASTIARATVLGAASSSCSYAAAAMGKSLFQKGADFVAAMVFMLASTNLVVELGIVLALLIGWEFTASEVVGGIVMIALFALLARAFLPERMVESARRRLRGDPALAAGPDDHRAATDEAGHRAAMEGERPRPLRERARSLAEWADAASYAIADITMLRRELFLGFTIAGFLAVVVPKTAWNAIFVSGHGLGSAVENAVIGPFIAIISFVCSIGNVPLAAALWKGGISFGGVVSFIFADLITLPLLLIYRRYYGWGVTLRLAALFWVVMSLGGLIVEGLFSIAHLVPGTRVTQIAPEGLRWDHTTVLDILALVLLGALYALHRSRSRLGGGARYAIDPVCRMQVERVNSPARHQHAGIDYHFCSDGCREQFAAEPARFARSASAGDGAAAEGPMSGHDAGMAMSGHDELPGCDP